MTKTIKVSSIELPKDDDYKMTKVQAKGGQFNYVSLGDSVVGALYTNPIEIGKRCQVVRSISSLIDTNVITNIELTDDPAVILLTTASDSVYELVNLDMVKNVIEKV